MTEKHCTECPRGRASRRSLLSTETGEGGSIRADLAAVPGTPPAVLPQKILEPARPAA